MLSVFSLLAFIPCCLTKDFTLSSCLMLSPSKNQRDSCFSYFYPFVVWFPHVWIQHRQAWGKLRHVRSNWFQKLCPSGLNMYPCVTFLKVSALDQTSISLFSTEVSGHREALVCLIQFVRYAVVVFLTT